MALWHTLEEESMEKGHVWLWYYSHKYFSFVTNVVMVNVVDMSLSGFKLNVVEICNYYIITLNKAYLLG